MAGDNLRKIVLIISHIKKYCFANSKRTIDYFAYEEIIRKMSKLQIKSVKN